MKKLLLIPVIAVALSAYFVLTLFILPEKFLNKELLEPSPFFDTELSSSEISFGDSFYLEINSKNMGEYGDIHILSIAFPTLDSVNDVVQIISYDFSNSPVFIEPGDEIGSEYTGGVKTVIAEYPFIEAMNRPVPTNAEYHLKFLITPKEPGEFLIYVKNIDIPHISQNSHYPQDGVLDHQNEYVKVYKVMVHP